MTGLRIFILTCVYITISGHLIFAFTPPAPKGTGPVQNGAPNVGAKVPCPLGNITERMAKMISCMLSGITSSAKTYAECLPENVIHIIDLRVCVADIFIAKIAEAPACIPANVSSMVEKIGDCFVAKYVSIIDKLPAKLIPNNATLFDQVPACYDKVLKQLNRGLAKCFPAFVASFVDKPTKPSMPGMPGSSSKDNPKGTDDKKPTGSSSKDNPKGTDDKKPTGSLSKDNPKGNENKESTGSSSKDNPKGNDNKKSTETEAGPWKDDNDFCLNTLSMEVKYLSKNKDCDLYTDKIKKMISTYKRARKDYKTLKKSCPAK